jgi:hypothetical protein
VQSTRTATSTGTITPLASAKNSIISYPSPARGNALWFYFNADKPGRLEIVIYNVTGEKVGNLETDLAQSGPGRLKWMGDLAPGVYLYRAHFLDVVGEGTWLGTQKIAIVKP